MPTFTPDTSNTLFQLATGLISQTSRNIFLTGKAGTGKTTFLKYIREAGLKQMAIVAPTGVAAINAGGVTLHSFFQLPLSPFIPATRGTGFSSSSVETSNPHSLVSRLRFNRDKKKLLQELELLVIDEISMVRADLLDAVDTVLRHVRRRLQVPFGGVQVLFIGDMFQLPPVVKDAEWKILSDYYDSPFFFDSKVVREAPPLYIEFDKIYRQSELGFIRVLNQVRNNELDEEGLSVLESRYLPNFRRSKDDGYIILTTHNEQARHINLAQLKQLSTPAREYQARVENEFPENAYPADFNLVLKEGAQVMFIRNEGADKGKRYFNGKIGIVTRLEEEKIFVRATDDNTLIEVGREKWDNIRYTLDKGTQTMKEDLLGSFAQFPLRLAWAITIHKSQGLTFEKAIIDAGEAFAPGQVYVALSRCTSLDGLVLKSRLRKGSLFTDPRILRFAQQSASADTLQRELAEARRDYQLTLLLDAFRFTEFLHAAGELKKFLLENRANFNADAPGWGDQLVQQLNTLDQMAQKFHPWLQEQFRQPQAPDENEMLKDRLQKAAAHFVQEIRKLMQFLKACPLITDSKLVAKECNESLRDLFAGLGIHENLLNDFNGIVDIDAWHQQRKRVITPSFGVNVYAGAAQQRTESPHPELFAQLKRHRDAICLRKDIPVYLVASSSTLEEMARYLPHDKSELLQISGMGAARVEQYGKGFLEIILDYCAVYELPSLIHEKSHKNEKKKAAAPAKKKGETYRESFELYKQGKSIAEIAAIRHLATGTIESHLARFVESGEIALEDLVDPARIALIKSVAGQYDGHSITPLKQLLGNQASFGEIRLVLASLGITPKRKDVAEDEKTM